MIVGWANGCFDLFHEGHRHFLAEAAARCDRLIVGLNTDESVRILKGRGRPIYNYMQRARAIQDLAFAVVPYDDYSAYDLMRAVNASIIFRGYDQAEGAFGLPIERIAQLPGFSTTNEIAKRAQA